MTNKDKKSKQESFELQKINSDIKKTLELRDKKMNNSLNSTNYTKIFRGTSSKRNTSNVVRSMLKSRSNGQNQKVGVWRGENF